MKLKEWLKIKNMNISEFQRLSGVSRPTIYKALEEWENIDYRSAKSILSATGGDVLVSAIRQIGRIKTL